ncbi:MAG: hypothetical protein Q8M95_02110 [Candidatus Methanoperedens sp.]|nr:hypothetical protein [Candidatus Methanoperedens sp.]
MRNLSGLRVLIAMLLIAGIAQASSGPTYVSGVISSNTTWSSNGNPYIINGNILVEPGANIVIEPGVIVKFDGNYYIRVDGSLNAIGTPKSRIIFTSNKENPSINDWKGIYFGIQYQTKVISPLNSIKYSNIMYAETGVMNSWGGIYPVNISNNIFYSNNKGYQYIGGGSNGDILINNTFIGNSYGIWIWLTGQQIIQYNIIAENDVGIYFRVDAAGSSHLMHNISYNDIYSNRKFNLELGGNGGDLNAILNYWGENSSDIDKYIYDFYDDKDFSIGKVSYTPFLRDRIHKDYTPNSASSSLTSDGISTSIATPIPSAIQSPPLTTKSTTNTPNPQNQTNWTLLGSGIIILFFIGTLGLYFLKPKRKTSQESSELEIKRGYVILENKDLRFGILVKNISKYTVNDVDVLLKYDRSLFSLKDKEVMPLFNITKNSEKTATYILTPLVGCVHHSKISAIISYKDASDNSHTVQMRPKEVHCISPFLAEKPMTEGEFSKLYENHSCLVEGIVFKGISADAVTNFIVDSAKNKRYVVKNSFVNGTHIIYLSSVAKDKTFYLNTVIIRGENSLTYVGLRACSNNEGGINNFINEILTSLRHYVNSVQSAREVENVTNNISVQIINSEVHGGVSIGGNAQGRNEGVYYGSRR